MDMNLSINKNKVADETVGKPFAQTYNEPELRVTKLSENYGQYVMYEFKFIYLSGESHKFQIDEKTYELIKNHFKHPIIH